MAAGVIHPPGTKLGPCEDCDHIDCRAAHKLVSEICATCKEPIGFDRRFYICTDAGPHEHAVCAEERVEKERAR